MWKLFKNLKINLRIMSRRQTLLIPNLGDSQRDLLWWSDPAEAGS